MVFELITGDLLFDPREGDGYDRDEGIVIHCMSCAESEADGSCLCMYMQITSPNFKSSSERYPNLLR
jgi:hypothetical protein